MKLWGNSGLCWRDRPASPVKRQRHWRGYGVRRTPLCSASRWWYSVPACLQRGLCRAQRAESSSYSVEGIPQWHGTFGKRSHLGDLLQSRFYWPGMISVVQKYVASCDRCIQGKIPENQTAPLVNITSSQPQGIVCLVFYRLKSVKVPFGTPWSWPATTPVCPGIPDQEQDSTYNSQGLVGQLYCSLWISSEDLQWSRRNFENDILNNLCEMTVQSNPYHAMSNGACEWFTRTLINMLRTLEPYPTLGLETSSIATRSYFDIHKPEERTSCIPST